MRDRDDSWYRRFMDAWLAEVVRRIREDRDRAVGELAKQLTDEGRDLIEREKLGELHEWGN